jgi:hypothetical protein
MFGSKEGQKKSLIMSYSNDTSRIAHSKNTPKEFEFWNQLTLGWKYKEGWKRAAIFSMVFG